MQAINEVEVGDVGQYSPDFFLIPWGLVYKVERIKTYQNDMPLTHIRDSVLFELQSVRNMVKIPPIPAKYPAGTWEFGAISTYVDGHYQAGLFFFINGIEI